MLKLIRTIKGKLGILRSVIKLVGDPYLSETYYPNSPRKSKNVIFWENLLWVVKNKEVNKNYYVYGMDRKNGLDGLQILPYSQFKRLRDSRNLKLNKDGYNYICLLRDKFIFSQFLKSVGIPTTENIAIVEQEELLWLDNMKSLPLEDLVNNKQFEINGFCKKLDGILGKGAFPLKISKGKLFVNQSEITLDDLKNKIKDGKYLLQALISQHQNMKKLNPTSVNTIRLITFNDKGKVTPFCAALRIGTGGGKVDNWASGGIVVGIDLDTGKLEKYGFFKPGYGLRVIYHPDTNVKLEGFEIPYFKEALALSCKLHKYVYGIHSIGWDIAITPDGPLIIEGNDNWEGGIPMSIEKQFKSRFLEFYKEEESLKIK